MFDFLRRISASLTGIVLFSVSSILINLSRALLMSLLAVFGAIIFPVALPLLFYRDNRTLWSVAVGLIWGLILVLATPVLILFLPIALMSLAFYAVANLVYNIYVGAITGYQCGFLAALSAFLISFRENPFITIFNTKLIIRQEQLVSLAQTEDFSNLVDVSGTPNEVPDIEERQPTNIYFSLLTEKEITLASQIDDLNTIMTRYHSLYERLEKLDEALKQRGNPEADLDFDDEIIVLTPIMNPVLLVKQYYDDKAGKWKAVFNSTYITDLSALKKWLAEKNSHPLNRDKIVNDQDSSYRYRYHVYKKMDNCQELREMVAEIRKILTASKNAAVEEKSAINAQSEIGFFRPNITQRDMPELTYDKSRMESF